MERAWVVRLDPSGAAALGELRLVEGLEICQTPDGLWLRGDELDEALELALRSLPGGRRYFVLDDGQLVPCGKRVPAARLPQGEWKALRAWLAPSAPIAHLAGQSNNRAAISLVRGGPQTEPEMLLTARQAWIDWAATAPQARLDRLEVAASSDGRVLVRGRPLPPIHGEALVVQSGVAAPAGWTCHPAVDAPTVRDALGLIDDEIALLWPDGSWERIPHGSFTRASRTMKAAEL
jgi:hypothetical protein